MPPSRFEAELSASVPLNAYGQRWRVVPAAGDGSVRSLDPSGRLLASSRHEGSRFVGAHLRLLARPFSGRSANTAVLTIVLNRVLSPLEGAMRTIVLECPGQPNSRPRGSDGRLLSLGAHERLQPSRPTPPRQWTCEPILRPRFDKTPRTAAGLPSEGTLRSSAWEATAAAGYSCTGSCAGSGSRRADRRTSTDSRTWADPIYAADIHAVTAEIERFKRPVLVVARTTSTSTTAATCVSCGGGQRPWDEMCRAVACQPAPSQDAAGPCLARLSAEFDREARLSAPRR